jgi:hypothetical protein
MTETTIDIEKTQTRMIRAFLIVTDYELMGEYSSIIPLKIIKKNCTNVVMMLQPEISDKCLKENSQ